MNQPRLNPTRTMWALLALGAGLGSAAAQAADTGANSDARARYERERTVCTTGQSQESQQDCLREAKSAYDEARRGELGHGMQPSYDQNRKARCEPLKGDEHDACIARMDGKGTVSGSVAQGGIYRELVTVEPAPSMAPSDLMAPAPAQPRP